MSVHAGRIDTALSVEVFAVSVQRWEGLERARTLDTMFVFATSNQINSLAFEADDSLFSKRKFNFFAVFLCPLDQGRLEPLGILCRQHSRPGSYTFLPRRSALPSFVVD